MNVKTSLRFFYTVKFLRWEQIWFRIYYNFFKVKPTSKITSKITFVDFGWNSPSYSKQCFFSENEVEFIGKAGRLSSVKSWNSPDEEKLWLYNAHYFDDLNSIGNERRYELQVYFVQKWIDENPSADGNGWEAYPLSLRIVNWLKWLSRHNDSSPKILTSLHQQVDVLNQKIEYHILGNHLFANAKALIFYGSFISGEDSDKFLQKGLKILNEELSEQFLNDGGHFERSPMYHEILLWDLLDLINLAQLSDNKYLRNFVEQWKKIASKAWWWLKVMTHPDGEISFFNDASIGIAPSPAIINSYCEHLSIESAQTKSFDSLATLKASGYSRVSMSQYVLFFDHASIGPDYLPGHAHADTLSLELSVDLQRVLVNSGTSLYGQSAERLRQRKTAAHNTVEINNDDSSEVWGGFRVARRAKVVCEQALKTQDQVTLVASHDGYKRFKGKPLHRRKLIANQASIEVVDYIEGMFDVAYASFHLHPDVDVRRVDSKNIFLILKNKRIISVEATEDISVVDASWHPRFGVDIKNLKMILKVTPMVRTTFTIL